MINRMTLAHPTFIQPAAPDALPIIEMHRGTDGYVAFQRRTAAGQFERVFSVKASELPELFPQFIAPHVDEESYFSVNTMHLRPWQITQRSKIDPRFPTAQWGSDQLRYLTSCYVDLDCYKLGMTIGQCIGLCIDAQDKGLIPPVSIITRSGRGVWLFWFLRDDENERAPVRAWAENVSTYRKIERHLLREFGSLGADPKAIDPARITRVPGSMHRQCGSRVNYWMQLDSSGRPFSYRLDDLAGRLGVRPTKYPASIARAVNPKFRERGLKGYNALHRKMLGMFLSLLAHRGTIAEGGRNHAALLFSSMLHRCKIEKTERIESVKAFGERQCLPPLRNKEIADAIREGEVHRKFNSYTIGDWLKITPAESALIGWPAEGSRPAESDITNTKADRTRTRREKVRSFVEHPQRIGSTVPTIRQIVDYVETTMGERPSTGTIQNDLAELGIVNPRRQRRQPPDSSPCFAPSI